MKGILFGTIVLVLVVSVTVSHTDTQPADAGNLQSYQWSYRLLIVGAPSETDVRYRALAHALRQQVRELRDRNMVILHLFETGVSHAGHKVFDTQDALHLREQLALAPGELTTVLIGKDGREKQRQTNRIDLGEILELIDTMPMRQQEMRQRGR